MGTSDETPDVRVEFDDGVLRLTKANPEAGYGVTVAVMTELTTALRRFRDRPDLRAVVIDSEGGFHEGAVLLGELKPRLADLEREDFRALVHRGHDLGRLIASMPVAVIGVARDGALGGGLELLLRCDLVFCTDTAAFTFPEVTLGLVAAWGGTQLAGRLMQYRKAQEMLLLGQPVTGRQAEQWGLVTRSFADDDELTAHVTSVLERLRSCAPASVRWTKSALAAVWDGPLEHGEALEVTAEEEATAATSLTKVFRSLRDGRPIDFFADDYAPDPR